MLFPWMSIENAEKNFMEKQQNLSKKAQEKRFNPKNQSNAYIKLNRMVEFNVTSNINSLTWPYASQETKQVIKI